MALLVLLVNLALSMPMALGPDYTNDLAFSVAYVGWVYGSFTPIWLAIWAPQGIAWP